MAFRTDHHLTGSVNIVTALPAEARPLVGHFELRSSRTDPFSVYTNGDSSVRLIVSGVGKSAAGRAVKHLAGLFDSTGSNGWLNVGIAGHESLPLGTMVAAHKISDEKTGRSWFPPIVLDFPCETATLLTVEEETDDYPDNALVEMEAVGFYATASDFSTHELIHCLKVVSDNRREKKLDGKSVSELITAQLAAVESVVQSILQLSAELGKRRVVPRQLKDFLEQWKFTVTQSHQLEKLLRRWEVIFPKADPFEAASPESRNGRDVVQLLSRQLAEASVEAEQL